MPGMPLRGDRIHRYVTAFCPHCHDEEPLRELPEVPRLAGYLAERDGRIWLERGCAVHGRVTTLYDEHPAFLRFFERHNHRIEVYLQFDGFPLETHRAHRGADLRRIKSDVVRRLSDAGVFTTLTMTAALDINDDEIGDVVRLALDTPFIGG